MPVVFIGSLKNNKKNMEFYFAYGSNMNTKRMDERGINYDQIIPATLENYELKFNKVSKKQGAVANVMPKPGSVVEGILYRIADITVLDRPEGFPNHYDRVIMWIAGVQAWVYIAQPKYIKEGLRPKKEYLNHILEGKSYMSTEYYEKLLKS